MATAPGAAHDYVSGCPLATPVGSMRGHYIFARLGGAAGRVKAEIPFFALAAPATAS